MPKVGELENREMMMVSRNFRFWDEFATLRFLRKDVDLLFYFVRFYRNKMGLVGGFPSVVFFFGGGGGDGEDGILTRNSTPAKPRIWEVWESGRRI